ncbi:MAG: cyclic nucleotide-binding domain-containing protein [Bdellovibrionales bacterium]|nr:cyclic nucleotide-binding domain-containing protein [Bdellovibrionales bacterium]
MSEVISLKQNEVLFKEGDYPDCMYIVRSGAVSIYVIEHNREKALTLVGPGNLIGEMGLFDKGLRSASAKAIEDSELVKLPYFQLEKQMELLPEWVKITMKSLSEKLRVANKK